MTERLGVFGGTFDPPHRSHVFAVVWALQSGEIDRVLIVPTGEHAFGKRPSAPFAHRLEMCRLSVREIREGLVSISDIEGRRVGTSYMIETLRALRGEYPEASLRLIVGSDILGELHLWKEPEAVKQLAPLLIVPRLGHTPSEEIGHLPRLSSTDVRQLLEAGHHVSNLVPARVLDYIREHHLYLPS